MRSTLFRKLSSFVTDHIIAYKMGNAFLRACGTQSGSLSQASAAADLLKLAEKHVAIRPDYAIETSAFAILFAGDHGCVRNNAGTFVLEHADAAFRFNRAYAFRAVEKKAEMFAPYNSPLRQKLGGKKRSLLATLGQ
jgi:hypothetical protein